MAILAILLCGLLFGVHSADAAQQACLECHTAHYRTQGSCTSCHRGDPRTARMEIAHNGLIQGRFAHFNLPDSGVLKRGLRRLETAGCRRCHVSGGKGNRLASDLDRVARVSAADELVTSISQPAVFMPEFRFSDGQLVELVNALFAGMAKAPADADEVPRVVHFRSERDAERHVFDKHCGNCHRLMSGTEGGLGEGTVGPNLSGLLTPFYPGTFRDEERWRRENLEKWLKNPRSARPTTVMAPPGLKEEERLDLLRFFDAEAHKSDSGTGAVEP